MSAYFLHKENHLVAFSAALSMPEHAKLSVIQFSCAVSLDSLIYTEILVVSCKNFCSMTA